MKKDDFSDEVAKFILSCEDSRLKELTVTSLARCFDIDRSYLTRIFKSSNECTLYEFIVKEKMSRAAACLRNSSDLTIKELSEKMGFLSTDHFSRVFKRHFGIVPSKYRDFKNGV